ncbi:MAG TPA: class I SAM-dependent methyltransferase [Rhodanobacteraceae bacterium]|nr:class I SAM-dependent methyltransferase [Rhodanobacteraceae bacterium]
MTAELARLRRVWSVLGREDPLWAVLSHPRKRGGRWRNDEFFATGRLEVDSQMAALAAHGLPQGRRLALDFGCGAGRLTRALAAHFEHVLGVDVAPSMIAAARVLNADVDAAEFRENASVQLDGVAGSSVDLVYSCMTLQHMPAGLAAGYVAEFLRVLAPGGIAVFQFITGPDTSLRGRLFARVSNRWLNPLRRVLWRRATVFEMHALPEERLIRLLEGRPDLRVLHAEDDRAAGRGWHGRRWIVARAG